MNSALWCITCVCLLHSCAASPACDATSNDRCQEDDSDLHDEVHLLQNYISSGHRRLAQMGYLPLQDSRLDLKMSEEQIVVELQLAKHVHEQWENRIAVLQDLLSFSRRSKHSKQQPIPKGEPIHTIEASGENARFWSFKLVIPLIVGILALCFAVWKGFSYEKQREKHDSPWYHNSRCMSNIITAVSLMWLMSGIFFFTGFFHFSNGGHLTFIESLYLSSQILTTVGYGDLTPTTTNGQIFMVFYVIIGVVLIASLTAELIQVSFERQHETLSASVPFLGKLRFWREHQGIIQFSICLAFGTLLYGSLEGEEKTYFQAFYMSVMTLTSVGFGYFSSVTPVGQLIGSVWMILGWVATTNVIADASDAILQQRSRLQSKAAAMNYFDKICDESQKGGLNRAEFLGFECLRYGLHEEDLQRANSAFDKFDTDQSQNLELKEFKSYVDTIDFLQNPRREGVLRRPSARF